MAPPLPAVRAFSSAMKMARSHGLSHKVNAAAALPPAQAARSPNIYAVYRRAMICARFWAKRRASLLQIFAPVTAALLNGLRCLVIWSRARWLVL